MNFINGMAERFRALHRKIRRRRGLVMALAAVVVFVTTYSMILPAITLDENTASTQAGMDVAGSKAEPSGDGEAAQEKENTDSSGDAADKADAKNTADSTDSGSGSGTASEDVQASDADRKDESTNTKDAGSDAQSGGNEVQDAAAEEGTEKENAAGAGTGSATDADASLLEENTEGVANTLKAETDRYSVTIDYAEDAGLPDDVSLSVKELSENSSEYKNAFNAVVADKKDADQDFDEDSLGMAALDISILDADGNKIEPAADARVNVKIEMKELPEDAAPESVEVQHIEEDGKTKATTVADVGNATDGSVEVKDNSAVADFSVDSFSTYAFSFQKVLKAAAKTSDYTVEVGSTTTINASSDLTGTPNKGTVNTWSWSSSNTGIATASGSSSTGTVTGVAAGTATITVTHTYSTNKNKTTSESKTYTVKVTDSSSSSDETLTGSGGDITVTVKNTGTTKKLEGLYLIVEKLSSGSDYTDYLNAFTSAGGDTNNLKGMYHIYLSNNADGSGEEVSVSNVNLDVTITDSDLNGVSSAKVGHFKKNSSGIVETQSVDGTAAIKKVTVSDGSITFKIKSFSVFTIEAEDSTSTDTTTGIVTSHTQGGTDSTTGDYRQINYAYESSAVNGNGIKKTIEPTNTENVFKVTIELDRKPSTEAIKEYFQSVGGVSLQSEGSFEVDSGYTDGPGAVGTRTKVQSNDYRWYSTEQGKGSFVIHYVLSDGTKFDVTYYRESTANKGTYHRIIAPLPNGKWIELSARDYKVENTISAETVNLNSTITNYLYETFAADISSVTNTINTSMYEYLGNTSDGSQKSSGITGTYVSASAPNSNGVMTVNVSSLSQGKTGTFSYYVRLKVENESTSDSMTGSGGNPVAQSGTNYYEDTLKASVTVKYTTVGGGDTMSSVSTKTSTKTLTVNKPGTSGVLYYVELEKVSSEDTNTKLSGAEFALIPGNVTTYNKDNVVATLTTDSSGKGYTTTGVPYGTYTLFETKAPSGYQLQDDNRNAVEQKYIGTYNLGYLGDSTQSSWTHDQLDNGYLGKKLTGNDAITNPKAPGVDVKIVKYGSDNIVLSGAKFSLYKSEEYYLSDGSVNPSASPTATYTSDDQGILVNSVQLEAGQSYVLVEDEAPDGYQILSKVVDISVENDLTVSSSWTSTTETDRVGSVTITQDKTNNTATISITDEPTHNITIIKTDNSENPVNLSGATFKLTKLEGENNNIPTDVTGINSETGEFTIEEKDKEIGITLKGLTDGTYKLTEVSAPAGYVVLSKGIEFKVTSSKIEFIDSSSIKDFASATGYKLTVKNTPGEALPNTGGSGTTMFTLGGIALITASALMYGFVLRQKNRERRFK